MYIQKQIIGKTSKCIYDTSVYTNHKISNNPKCMYTISMYIQIIKL